MRGLPRDEAQKELIRAVRSPEGEVSLDPTGRKAGRGAYVCMNADCLKKALKQKQLDRALEAHLDDAANEQLTETMRRLLAERKTEENT